MKRFAVRLLAPALVSLLLAGSAVAQEDPVVMTVGDEQITQSQFELIIQTLAPEQRSQLQSPEARRQLAEQITELKVMAQEGRRRRMDQDPVIQMNVILQAERALARAAFEQLMAEPPDEALLQAFYDEHVDEFEQAVGSHILIRFKDSPVPLQEGQADLTDIEALQKITELREKLQAGADFAEMAKTESDDRGSGQNGGDLGFFRRGEMIEEFTDTAFSIPLGEVSNPIKTEFGYHLIVIRERGFVPFEDVKDEIQEGLLPEIGQAKVSALKAETKVEYNPAFFGGAPAEADPFAPPTQR